MYRAPFDTAQGRVEGNISANMSLSKDILKDKATITANVTDLFDSRKREVYTTLPQSHSYSQMQWRGRQMNISFTYRFNQPKNQKQRGGNKGQQDDSEMELI